MYCIRKHLAIVIARGRFGCERWIWIRESVSRDREITLERLGARRSAQGVDLRINQLFASINVAGYHSSP